MLSLLLAIATSTAHADEPSQRIPIVFHIAAAADEAPTRSPFIERQLAFANRVFAPLGIAFVNAGEEPIERGHARLVTRTDRNQLLRYVRPGAIHCVIVDSLMDVDEEGRERRGVHWYSKTPREGHLIIVSVIAMDFVMAHELGHFLGNRRHSQTPGNLMSYTQTEALPFLDAQQQGRVLRTLRRMLDSGELRKAP